MKTKKSKPRGKKVSEKDLKPNKAAEVRGGRTLSEMRQEGAAKRGGL